VTTELLNWYFCTVVSATEFCPLIATPWHVLMQFYVLQICFLIAQTECLAHLWHVCHPPTFATMGVAC